MSRFEFNSQQMGAHAAGELAHAAQAVEAQAAHAFSAAEHGLLSTVAAHAAEVSPIIQMIMRMPSHIGLFSSMFEAFGNFFLPQAHSLMAGFDPSVLGLHDLGAHLNVHIDTHSLSTSLSSSGLGHGNLLSEHMGVDGSLLPKDAPFFSTLGHMPGSFTAHGGFEPFSGSSSTFGVHPGEQFLSLKDRLNVSGQVDLAKPQFEGGKALSAPGAEALKSGNGVLSGPGMNEVNPATHLAGANRLFSDRLPQFNSNQVPTTQSSSTIASAQGAGAQAQSLPNSLNVGASVGGQAEALPAVAQPGDMGGSFQGQNVGFTGADNGATAAESTGSSLGPSGALTNQLGANRMLASNDGITTFRPRVGALENGSGSYDASYLQTQTPAADHGSLSQTGDHAAASTMKGLKAKPLSLDSINGVKPAAHTNSALSAHPHHSLSSHPHSGVHAQGLHHKAIDRIAHTSRPKVQYDDHAHGISGGPAEQGQQPIDGQQIAQAQAAQSPVEQAPVEQAPVGPDGQPLTDAAQQPASYTIRAGDCLWNIARDHLGSATKWTEIYKMNQDLLGANPDLVYPGQTIQLPGGQTDIASATTEATKYVVKPGDNLWNISKNTMGDATKWGDLYKVNADVIGANPRLIFPGQELTIPGAPADSSLMAQASTQAPQQLAQLSDGSQIQAAAQAPAPDAGMGAEAAAQPQAVPQAEPQAGSYAQMEAPGAGEMTPQVTGGPGAAAAATLTHSLPINQAMPMQTASSIPVSSVQTTPINVTQAAQPSAGSVVTSTLSADLTNILRKGK